MLFVKALHHQHEKNVSSLTDAGHLILVLVDWLTGQILLLSSSLFLKNDIEIKSSITVADPAP